MPPPLRTISSYVRELRPSLPLDQFRPAMSRLWWLPVHLAIAIATIWALGTGRLPGWSWPLASLVIGCALAGITFLGHETLHGGVVRGRLPIRLVGWICMSPFMLSPQLWMAWHNRVHHHHTGQPGIDPDMYPTLDEYQREPMARAMADHFGLGQHRLRGLASLLFGFTGQIFQVLTSARRLKYVTPRQWRSVAIETVLGVAMWAAVFILVGPLAFVFVYVIPLVVANTIVMMFIVTNHCLSPLTAVNDPLVNSMSVTLPRPLEWLTLRFGYHTEHHLFPALSTRYGPRIREALRRHFPDRYQSMPLGRALRQLYRTARVYKDNITLIDPRSGRVYPVMGPDNAPSS